MPDSPRDTAASLRALLYDSFDDRALCVRAIAALEVAEREVAQLADSYASVRRVLDESEGVHADLRAEVERLSADGERLDWLAGQHVPISRVNDGWFVNFDMEQRFESMRAAIDAARSAK